MTLPILVFCTTLAAFYLGHWQRGRPDSDLEEVLKENIELRAFLYSEFPGWHPGAEPRRKECAACECELGQTYYHLCSPCIDLAMQARWKLRREASMAEVVRRSVPSHVAVFHEPGHMTDHPGVATTEITRLQHPILKDLYIEVDDSEYGRAVRAAHQMQLDLLKDKR